MRNKETPHAILKGGEGSGLCGSTLHTNMFDFVPFLFLFGGFPVLNRLPCSSPFAVQDLSIRFNHFALCHVFHFNSTVTFIALSVNVHKRSSSQRANLVWMRLVVGRLSLTRVSTVFVLSF